MVPPGHNGVAQLEVVIGGVSDPAMFDAFYGKGAGRSLWDRGANKVGDTIASVLKDPAASPTAASFAKRLEIVNAMAAWESATVCPKSAIATPCSAR